MLNLIATTDEATILSTSHLDEWGVPQQKRLSTFKCRIVFNSKRETISTSNGEEVVYTATLSVNNLLKVPEGALLEFIDPEGNKHRKEIISKSFSRDLSGSVLFTKLVV